MDKPILIHKHRYGTGGIGDFFRGIITLYQICKNENIDYYIDLNENPNLKNCFNLIEIPFYVKNRENEEHILIDQVTGNNEHLLLNLINHIKNNKNKIHYILFNGYGNFNFNLTQQNESIEYIKNNILKPKNTMINLVYDILHNNNLIENNYISIHVRCGDLYIAKENNNYFNGRSVLFDIYNYDKIKYFNDLIENFIQKYNISLPIVIHSDSKYFKSKLKELNNKYIILDIDTQHTANCLGNNDEKSYLSTLSEFYIISKANSTVMLDTYSGFPHLACLFGNNNLYTNNLNINLNEEIFTYLFTYLKPKNLIKLDT